MVARNMTFLMTKAHFPRDTIPIEEGLSTQGKVTEDTHFCDAIVCTVTGLIDIRTRFHFKILLAPPGLSKAKVTRRLLEFESF
jgi:hypothetical protein